MSKKNSAFGSVADLLSQFQVRLDKLTGRVNSDEWKFGVAVAEVDHLSRRADDLTSKTADAHRMATDALLDMEKQKETNKETTESLYKLRDSVQKAFDGISSDIKSLLTSQQRLNERLSKLEGSQILRSELSDTWNCLEAVSKRTATLESLNIASRDYEKINALEQRIAGVEVVIRTIKAFVGVLGSFKEK